VLLNRLKCLEPLKSTTTLDKYYHFNKRKAHLPDLFKRKLHKLSDATVKVSDHL
jgi:hypothetical protein